MGTLRLLSGRTSFGEKHIKHDLVQKLTVQRIYPGAQIGRNLQAWPYTDSVSTYTHDQWAAEERQWQIQTRNPSSTLYNTHSHRTGFTGHTESHDRPRVNTVTSGVTYNVSTIRLMDPHQLPPHYEYNVQKYAERRLRLLRTIWHISCQNQLGTSISRLEVSSIFTHHYIHTLSASS